MLQCMNHANIKKTHKELLVNTLPYMKRHNLCIVATHCIIPVLSILAVLFCSCYKEGNEPEAITRQEQDSITIVNAVWKETQIREGVKLKTADLHIFQSNQAIYLVEVDISAPDVIYAVSVPPDFVTTSTQAIEHDATVAINGTYFWGDYSSTDSRHFIKVDNVIRYYTQDTEFSTRATGIITITGNSVDISDWNSEKEKNKAGEAAYAMVSGPLIIDNGLPVKMWDNAFVYNRHPRTFMALKKGKIILGVVDGRDEPRAYGMNLTELMFFAKKLEYSDLINLDGGGSSTLYVKGYDADGVVNTPSDGKERAIKSIFYIKNKK